MNDIIIIGGGVAGLSAAIHCHELGIKPILIEAGSYPAHKVCGEFFSPECLPLLKRWGIEPKNYIKRATFVRGSQSFSFDFPTAVGSMPRYYFDHKLMQYAQSCGIDVRTQTSVEKIENDKDLYTVTTSSGKIFQSTSLVFGTGRAARLLNQSENPLELPYVGIKAHFKSVNIPADLLQMFVFPGGYAGVTIVDDGIVNLACLMRKDVLESGQTPESYLCSVSQKPGYENLLKIIESQQLFDWMHAQVPEFGIRSYAYRPGIFYIGDAAASIPPATGDGLAMGLLSGALVAPYVAKGDTDGFQKAWKKQYSRIFFAGRILHVCMMSCLLSLLGIFSAQLLPSLAQKFFSLTRTHK